MAFKKLCKTRDIPLGESKEFSLSDQDILVVNANGQFHCLSARCPHAGGSLAKGSINGEELKCPSHGYTFRITDGSAIFAGPGDSLRVYPCQVKGDNLFIELSPKP
jgi:nitrite reductase/ring-hydroxylating ferredoxin subunit